MILECITISLCGRIYKCVRNPVEQFELLECKNDLLFIFKSNITLYMDCIFLRFALIQNTNTYKVYNTLNLMSSTCLLIYCYGFCTYIAFNKLFSSKCLIL